MRFGIAMKACWVVALVLVCAGVSWGDDTAVHEDVVERYEQILERAPVEGPSFDKLLQIYQEGDGLEKLDERWAPWSAQPGAKGATYSLLRGLLADRMGKTDEARKFLQAATQAQPDDFHVWMALGDFEVRQGKWTDAMNALQKGLATTVAGDDRLALYRKLGQAQERNLEVPAALATWQKMVAEFPKDSFAVEEAGEAELDAEQFDEAKKTFQQLVDLTEPNSMARVQALIHLAEVDDRQGKTDDAVHDYEAILPLTAESSWLNRELRAQIEQVYRRQDDLAGLVAYYQKWTTDNPKDVEALLLLAGTLNELGKKPEALDVLRKVTTLAPDRHEVRESFAQGLVEAKQYDEAITVLTALTADDPTEPRYWATLGDALWLKTQPSTPESKKAVLDAWGHIAPPDTKDVAAVLEVADLCHDRGLNDEALAGYQRALGLTPDASDIREKAVKLLVEMKRPDNAWKLLEQMTNGNLATAANYLKLATLDLQFDRKDAAEAAIQKGLALEPGNFDLLSMQWTQLAEAQKWSDCVALFDKLMAAAPNAYFADQLEARQLQALTSAGMLDDTEQKLHAKLGADPGMTESELRLWLRMLIQKSDPDIAKALDEAHRRFPQSVSLIRIEIDYDRHVGNDDAAIAALQKLIETVPAQKADWLDEIVHIRRDQGNFDEALKSSQQIIDASPASADGYLLYADIALAAGKPDDAVVRLQAAIKLSDKPNDVRQRLAKYYLESGQTAKARTVYDEAFAAAENPQDKLAIVKAMTAAYFADGQIEDLINRFKKEQGSEEGGWRYGLYLSAIDEEMEDYGAARRELAKSLAVRPQDTALLHSLIGLADKEGDQGELLRYREMLAEADPSVTNEIALANEYAIQDKPEDAWRIVQKNLGEVAKDPMAWKDVLNQISDPAYAAKVKGVLEEAIRTKGDSFEGKFALVQFQMQQGDIEAAKGTLWSILEQPLPTPQPSATPATTATLPGLPALNNMYQSPLMQRAQQSYLAINEVQQLLSPVPRRNQMLQQLNVARMYNRMGISTTLDATAIRDHSLIYLSFIAVQQKQAVDFLTDLETKLDQWHWSLAEKLVAYSLIQAHEPLLQAIEEQAKSETPDKDLDQFCYINCQQFMTGAVDDPIRKRAEAARSVFESRLSGDPQFKSMAAMEEIGRLGADTSPAGVVKRNAAVTDYIKTLDPKDPEQLFQTINLYAQIGNWDEIKKTVDELEAINPSKLSVTVTQQLNYLPSGILQQATTTKEVMPKEVIPVVLKLMRMGYPATPPRASLPGTQSTLPGGMQVVYGGMGFYNQNTFPPGNRYFPMDRMGMLEPMYQQLKARDMLPGMYAALDQEEKDLGDWRKIYPELMRIYFQWWDGKHDDAVASVHKLLDRDPSDDWRLLLASMLVQDQKYTDAIPVLESVSARYGPDYIQTQKQLLHVARMAKNNDAGQKAALRLLSLHLPQMEQMQIMDDLRNVGLKDKADEIMAKQTQGRANMMSGMQANGQMMRSLNDAANHNDPAKMAELARQILNHDPLAAPQFGNESFMRTRALDALQKSGQLDVYIQDIEKQLAATPDSVRLNWLAAEAYLAESQPNGNASGAVNGSAEKAVVLFKKVEELSPKNPTLRVTVAEQLHRAHQTDAAADLYTSILKTDFTTGMTQWTNVLQTFEEAHRIPDFVKIITDWTPQPMNPMGGGQDMYYALVQVANQLKQNNHLPEAEQVYRKALTVDTFQSKQDGVTALAQLLMDENRGDDAAAEIEKYLLANDAPPTPPPILGFNVQAPPQNNWFQSMGWNANGVIMAPIIHFLEMADALGLSPKLREEFKARAAKAGTTPGVQIDSNRMAEIVLAIIARDPGYRAEVEQMLKDSPPPPQGMGINANSLLILSQLLEKWPEERPMAMRLTKRIYDSVSGGAMGNSFYENIIFTQMMRQAKASGDHKMMQDTLKKKIDSLRQQSAVNPNQVHLDQTLPIVHDLIQEGMLKEATDLLADAKADPQLAGAPGSNPYYQQKIDDMQNQLAFAKGEPSTVSLVYGLATKPEKKGTEFFWQIAAATKDQNNSSYFSHVPWMEGGVSRPTSYRIEVSGGVDEQHLTHFESWDNVATRGSAPIKIPEGMQVIQASLIRTKAEAPTATSSGTPPTPPQPVPALIATGQVLLLGGSENLLKNPDFEVSKDATGKKIIGGWHGLLSAGVSQGTAGPLPTEGYQSLESTSGNMGMGPDIVSDPIALQPNTNYVIGGWMRLSGNFGFRYADASGKVLNPNQNVSSSNDTEWQWREWVLQGDPRSPVGGESIPANAATVQIVIKPNQDSDFAGLSVRVWPAPVTK
jgi:tetratricopeptide (TPR) repeat protein